MTKTIVCSHGFGVRADSRGFFPALAVALPEWKFVTFDYNDALPNGDTRVSSLYAQAQKLQHVIDEAFSDETVLLAHSQGCLVPGLVDLTRVTRVILLAPPVGGSMKHVIGVLAKRPGAVYDPDGISKLPRADGTTTFLPKDYFDSFAAIDPLASYEHVAQAKPTVIIRATKDEVLGLTNVDQVASATHIDIAADHNFTGESRRKLAGIMREILVQ